MRLTAPLASLLALGLSVACDGVSRDPEAHFRGQGGEATGGAKPSGGESTGGSTPTNTGGSDAASGGSAGELPADQGGEPSATGGMASTGGTAGADAEAGSAGAAMEGGAAGASMGGSTGGSAGNGNSAGADDSDAVSKDGLIYWFSGDDLVGENGTIAQWRDRSGNQVQAVQPVADLRPKVGSFPYADRAAAVFDGQDDYLELPPLTADFEAGLTFFTVVRGEPGRNCMPLMELSNGSEIDDIGFLAFQHEFLYEVLEPTVMARGGSFGSGSNLLLDVAHAPNQVVVLSVNGQVSQATTFPLPAAMTRNQAFLGRSTYPACVTSSWAGEVAELLLYSRLLGASEQARVRSYLAEKWKCCVAK